MDNSAMIKKMGYIELILAMVLAGTIGMFVEFSKQPIINVVFYRCAIGAACLTIYILFKKSLHSQFAFSRKNKVLVGIVGISVVLNWVALFSSFASTSIGIATTIYHLQPIIIFFLGALLFKEKMNIISIIWLIVAFGGVILMVGSLDYSDKDASYLKGCLLALAAACLYAVATLTTKYIKNVSPYAIALVQLFIGILVLGPFVQFTVAPQTSLQWSSLIILGMIHSAFMYILLYSSFQKLPASSIAILSYIYPVVAVMIDYIVFKKALSPVQIIGGLMILSAGLFYKLDFNPFKK